MSCRYGTYGLDFVLGGKGVELEDDNVEDGHDECECDSLLWFAL